MKHKLLPINDIEVQPDWKGICSSPAELLKFIINSVFVEGADVENNYITSDEEPKGKDRRLLWIKTSSPEGLGFLIDGEYKMDWGLTGYPANIPFLHQEITTMIDGLRALEPDDLTAYGLNDTSGSSSQRMRWYIFEP